MSSVAAIAVLVAFTGCAKSTDMFDQGAIDERDRQEQERIDQQKETIVNQNYAAAFERAFGKVGSNVDWGFGRQPSREKPLKVDDAEVEQLSFAANGNITPCPYRGICMTFRIGCQGISYWCKRYDKK